MNSQKENHEITATLDNVYANGKIMGLSGGLYKILLSNTEEKITVYCRAKGAFRHNGLSPLVGDKVKVRCDRPLSELATLGKSDGGIVIEEILDRKSALIRPPLANLDCMFVTMAAASPAPILPTVDKLIAIAEHNSIKSCVVIGKCELDERRADEICDIYKKSGFDTFKISCVQNIGIDALREYIESELIGKTAAFAGASGVGKSTLMNKLFPTLSLETGSISQKIERGRHTTRCVDIYEAEMSDGIVYIADTPGFSMLDFQHFDFFSKDDLPYTFKEFVPYIGSCRYTKCSHTKEEGCAILEAIKNGEIPQSRHESFLEIYSILKNKKEWS